MRTSLIILGIISALAGGAWFAFFRKTTATLNSSTNIPNTMQLTSPSFANNQQIPSLYTCDGDNISPPLAWSDVLEDTKSFALTVIDPDAPGGSYAHWLVANIKPGAREILEGAEIGTPIATDFGTPGWGGPCPPSGIHHYVFTLYALNVPELSGLTKANFVAQVESHSIAKAELIGLYQRQ